MLTRYAMMKAKNNMTTLAEVASQYEKIHTVSITEYARVQARNNALQQRIKKIEEENHELKLNVHQWETREAQRLVEEAIDNKPLRRSARLAMLAARSSQ